MSRRIYPVILLGGRGARLWPVSRESLPKVFQDIGSPNSLLQDTRTRLHGITSIEAPTVVCNADHAFIVRHQLERVGDHETTVLTEPARRNTAPAIAAAAYWVAANDPDGLLLVLPSDHIIEDVATFRSTVARAADFASQGHLVTFGITPEVPETEYGYIKAGARLDVDGHGCAVDRFVEKPDAPTATAMLEEGGFYWNSGMFMLPLPQLLEEFNTHAPEIAVAASASVKQARPARDGDDNRQYELDGSFSAAPAISIDYAIMEPTRRACVVPCSIGWSDVGNWNALWKLADRDEDGNASRGDVLSMDCTNTFLRSDGPVIAAIGLEDVVVVATPDAILVGHQREIRRVNDMVDSLAERGYEQATTHQAMETAWGAIDVLKHANDRSIADIRIEAGAKLHLPPLDNAARHWVLSSGRASVAAAPGPGLPDLRAEDTTTLSPEDTYTVPVGTSVTIIVDADAPVTLVQVARGTVSSGAVFEAVPFEGK